MSAADLVAFANSQTGGTILVGVRETKNPATNQQQGKIVGCPPTDNNRLAIQNKAEDCVPPIELDIYVENLAKKPFFRIEIPSGSHKPYCTARGTYVIRGDGRNKPLRPSRLLSLLIEEEGAQFVDRFQTATTKIDKRLDAIDV